RLAALQRQGVGVYDAGNLVGPVNPSLPPDRGLRHLYQCIAWNRLVHDSVSEALAEGRMPILLGGDHSVGIGSISAVARHCRESGRPLRVLWLDAHADSNTADTTPSGNLHGIPIACLLGHGREGLTTLSGTQPALAPGQLTQVGIRSVDDEEKAMVDALGFEVFDMRQVDEVGMRS